MAIDRAVIIVMDSVGAGEMPDAADYGDTGSDTLGNIAKHLGGLNLPHMRELGLGNIHPIMGVEPVDKPASGYGKMAETSAGKDTTTGHWEMTGIITRKAFPVYPHGFPQELIEDYEKAIGRKTLGNKPASGTEIIKELGEEHMKTGFPIVYTSADSVFQVAAHEEIISVPELYKICQIARDMLTGDHAVSRVIARPFIGKPGSFTRTDRRKDFSLEPTGVTLLDKAKAAGYEVWGVGKIEDIFCGRGLTESVHIHNNLDGMEKTIQFIQKKSRGIIFTNLVDFDMVYGHRNDVSGYGKALMEFDAFLPRILNALNVSDILIITADHGCDPTTPSTDHSREYVPLLVYGKTIKPGVNLGLRKTFADISATVSEILELDKPDVGESFLPQIYAAVV